MTILDHGARVAAADRSAGSRIAQDIQQRHLGWRVWYSPRGHFLAVKLGTAWPFHRRGIREVDPADLERRIVERDRARPSAVPTAETAHDGAAVATAGLATVVALPPPALAAGRHERLEPSSLEGHFQLLPPAS